MQRSCRALLIRPLGNRLRNSPFTGTGVQGERWLPLGGKGNRAAAGAAEATALVRARRVRSAGRYACVAQTISATGVSGNVNQVILALWHNLIWEEVVFRGVPLLALISYTGRPTTFRTTALHASPTPSSWAAPSRGSRFAAALPLRSWFTPFWMHGTSPGGS